MSEQSDLLTTNRKALTVNLNELKYGTFAEIGAGQEVARMFFQAGGASGTIAKSISAYDMAFSDAIYGKAPRYVSKERLALMLGHEYDLLVERLAAQRGERTTFFVFADTVATKSYKGNNEAHGWMGIRFQTEPGGPPSDIVLHVRMWDRENVLQQQALGIIGVNVVYGAFYYRDDPEKLIRSLLDNLGPDRIEVDMLQFSGPAFQGVDNRLMSLKLVQSGLTNAVMFGPNGTVLQPSEVLYKKAILVERGSFRPVTHVNVDMLTCATAQFVQEPLVKGKDVMVLMEITMNNLLEIFNEKYYENLEGGILESFGRLFRNAVKLYVYPMRQDAYDRYVSTGPAPAHAGGGFSSSVLINAKNAQVSDNLRNLYAHLLENHYLDSIVGYNPEILSVFSRDVLRRIKEGDATWETMVPAPVVAAIKRRELFGYKTPAEKPA